MATNEELLSLIHGLQLQIDNLKLELKQKNKKELTKLEYAKKYLKIYMEQYGLIEQGWNFGFNNRSRSAGVTKYTSKLIELSLVFIESSKVQKKNIMNTILHEIAHALVGYKCGHNKKWKDKAIEIGCNGKRCCETFNETYKYLLKCPNGCILKRMRIGKNHIQCKKHKMYFEIT